MTASEAALLSWSLEPGTAFVLLVSGLIYSRGWLRLSRQVPSRFPAWRLACFWGGLLALYLSVASPLDAFSSFLLSAHMVQHLLLTMVAPPLLLLGYPFLPMLAALPRSWASKGIGPFLLWPPLKALGHFITHPGLTWTLFVVSNVVWHIPTLYDLALSSSFWHEVEHFCFFGTGFLFWWPVIQPWPSRSHWPRWAMVPYLLLADLQNTALAGFLSFYDRVAYSTYENATRLTSLNALDDQAAAGAIMWVPGSLAFLIPAGMIAASYLSPKRMMRPSLYASQFQKPERLKTAKSSAKNERFDLFKVPILGPVLRWKYFRPFMQCTMLLLAVAIIIDGFLGPETSPMNLAGVLPWTHWRALTVVLLLVAGNFFCMSCPFIFMRDFGRKILPASWEWPRWLRGKWLAAGLIVVYLWAYEAFDLWDRPAITASVILAYFIGAFLIDGFFKGASFCKFVCPIGQFHFVQSLASPLEVKVRQPDVCATCRTFDCIKGNEKQRGCELALFQPRKQGNMDCTFCLDCVKACPHDNVGLIAVVPGKDLTTDPARSSLGRYARRPDLAVLVLILTFGAFANAAGMVKPVLDVLAPFAGRGEGLIIAGLALVTLLVLPLGLSSLAASVSKRWTQLSFRENFCRFAMGLSPVGISMWAAHFLFHFFTASHTPIPVFQRVLFDLGLSATEPDWVVPSFAFAGLPGMELLFLDAGLLLSLYILWKSARSMTSAPRSPWGAFIPWAIVALLLYLCGAWIIFQPMEMRGTMMH